MDELALAEVLRVLGGIVRGEPPPWPSAWRPLPWIGWLALALVRYRARERQALAEAGDPAPRGEVDGEQVAVDPSWLSGLAFAQSVANQRYASTISGRLTVLLQGGLTIAHLASWLVERLGGTRVGHPHWLRLPGELEALAGEIDPAFDAPPGAELDRVAAWLGDAQLTRGEPAQLAPLIERHTALIDRELARGEYVAAEALPALLHDSELTAPADALLERHRDHPLIYATLIDVLRSAPRAPASQFLAQLVRGLDPSRDAILFQTAVPYLLERAIEPAQTHAVLRGLAGLDPAPAALSRQPIVASTVLELLVREPEIGRGLVRHALVHEHQVTVREIAAMLVAIAAPWCITDLRTAQPTAVHQMLVLRALAHLGAGPTTSAEGPYRDLYASTFAATPSEPPSRNSLAAAIQNWERSLELLTPEARELLALGGARPPPA